MFCLRISSIRPALVVAAATAVLGACGGGGGGSGDGVASLDDAPSATATDGSAPPTTQGGNPDEQLLEYAACMREHGVDMPDPVIGDDGGVQIQIDGGGDGEGPTPEQMNAAMDDCGDLMPRMGPLDGGDFDPTEMQDAMVAFTQCMRQHGVDIDDPDFDDEGRFDVTVTAPDNPGAESSGAVLAGPFGVLDMSDPATQEAFDTCSDETGAFGDMGSRPSLRPGAVDGGEG